MQNEFWYSEVRKDRTANTRTGDRREWCRKGAERWNRQPIEPSHIRQNLNLTLQAKNKSYATVYQPPKYSIEFTRQIIQHQPAVVNNREHERDNQGVLEIFQRFSRGPRSSNLFKMITFEPGPTLKPFKVDLCQGIILEKFFCTFGTFTVHKVFDRRCVLQYGVNKKNIDDASLSVYSLTRPYSTLLSRRPFSGTLSGLLSLTLLPLPTSPHCFAISPT